MKKISRKHWFMTGSLILIFITGCLFLTAGGYIYGKALLAKALLHAAWEKSVREQQPVKPWTWADTYPVARLLVPAYGVDEIVLAGAQGPVLAFGPGHLAHTGEPGGSGNCVLAGHRETSFRFLKYLCPGSEIFLEGRQGNRHIYRVVKSQVVTADDTWVLTLNKERTLTLVTCYPFDALLPGPLRYVVWAEEC